MPFDVSSPGLNELGYLLAEAPRNVVFVVGAGLSMSAGIPGWVGLNQELTEIARDIVEHDLRLSPQEKAARLSDLSIADPWILGDKLGSIIPTDKYVGAIRKSLSTNAAIPDAYGAIWALKPSGVVSFNLDQLAEKALGSSPEQVSTTLEESKYLRFLLLNRQFLFQPHGALANPKSWVLGMHARNRLLRDSEKYRGWISGLLSSRRLVIVGFRPREFSFESLLLADLRAYIGNDKVDHFWIVPDPDAEARAWASEYHLKLIPYSPSSSAHPEVAVMLRHLAKAKPREPIAGLVSDGASILMEELPPDDELRAYAIPEIRKRLNAALRGETGRAKDHNEQLGLMEALMERFSASVHMAWHMAPGEYEEVWGFRLVDEIGKGGFGQVWRVEDVVDGQTYAMKVLHESAIRQSGFLEAFRRGVRAMRILSDSRVDGMVRYRVAFDIPACVVMEFVDGGDFENAIISGHITELSDALTVVMRAGDIVRRGHDLDKQVLHRDLKPANVMIRKLWDDGSLEEVVVLDFDLSWYEGAIGRSMMHGRHLHNYVAPEQVDRKPGASSRHTAVDVFGLGMLLYFASTGSHPAINVQNTVGFRQETAQRIRLKWRNAGTAMSQYLSMVIDAATRNEQASRPSMATVIGHVAGVEAALRSGTLTTPGDLANLECASVLLDGGWKTDLSLDGLGKILLKRNQCTVEMGFGESHGELAHRTEMYYAHGGDAEWSRVVKYGKTKVDRALSCLRKNNLFRASKSGTDLVAVTAETTANQWTVAEAQRRAEALANAADELAFVEK
jgi:serine/threonine protein kinase